MDTETHLKIRIDGGQVEFIIERQQHQCDDGIADDIAQHDADIGELP